MSLSFWEIVEGTTIELLDDSEFWEAKEGRKTREKWRMWGIKW